MAHHQKHDARLSFIEPPLADDGSELQVLAPRAALPERKTSMKRVGSGVLLSLAALLLPLGSCIGILGDDESVGLDGTRAALDTYRFAGGCYALRESGGRWLTKNHGGTGYDFVAGTQPDATPFRMQPADLGTYLLYDSEKGYLLSQGKGLARQTWLRSDLTEQVDRYTSEAEWVLEGAGPGPAEIYHLRHRKTGGLLSTLGVRPDVAQAAILSLVPTTQCAEHPELSLDATGTVQPRTFPDGSVWGIVEPHTHIMANFGFGGGGVVHGAPFHRLGVEHALGDCKGTHGPGGARDLFGNVFENKISADFIFGSMLPEILAGHPQGLFHETAGYPNFPDWPSAHFSSTHQVQYYKWIDRAWMAGLRVMVQNAVSNSIICELSQGLHLQTPRHGCADMAQVDREIEEIYAMERYIDAQAGGPGKGFFRIVTAPAEARQVIKQGKLAVLLGIETSNLFDCMLSPRPGLPTCDAAYVERMLDTYHQKGIRALFPVHKFDNVFSAGDGSRDFIEVGNLLNSGHHSDFVTEGCPGPGAAFDRGSIAFAGINKPRNDYASKAPYDVSRVSKHPIATLLPHVPKLLRGGATGDFCQKHGLTRLGEFLLREMMKRGMIIEVDHLPQHSYARAMELLTEYNYPPSATHGSQGPKGQVYALGGISVASPGRCQDPNRKGAMLDGVRDRIARKTQLGAYPGEAWSWDLNGFAGAPGPRFGAKSVCSSPQTDPITYPFKSWDGDVTFTKPRVGNRTLDFNTEGLVHIGLLPEIVEDLRKDANSDGDLEPLFRSAEAYLRMWEKAERRAVSIRAWGDDDCPFDDDKTELGVCGCGVSDADMDQDGTPDCSDRCALDPLKTEPGLCGCAASDADADTDGVPDCNDLCPGDPDKLSSGACGCGAAEADADGDGLPNCQDLCPKDASKVDLGSCGCSIADTDTDADATADCRDGCSSDAFKAAPGACGCGVADTDSDGDGTVDCNDRCPNDAGKTAPGECGCGVAEGKCGLMGTYFHSRDLTNPVLTRLDETINFDWGRGSPSPSMRDHDFSARWVGYVQAPSTGDHTFYTVTDDGVRLWVNEELLIDQWRGLPRVEHSGTIHLEAGKRYPIRLEYFEEYLDATCKLLWSSAETPKQTVPKNRLSVP